MFLCFCGASDEEGEGKGNFHHDSWQKTNRSRNEHRAQPRLCFPADKATAEVFAVRKPVDCNYRIF